ncbi:sulfite exporter TauE/SafE family protein [Mycoplasmatota bacterium zrk1]
MDILILIIIVFIGIFVQGLTGFGSSMMIIPLGIMIIDIKIMVATMIFINLTSNFSLFLNLRKHVNYKRILLLLVGGAIFTYMGSRFLVTLDTNILKKILAGILLVVAIMKIFKMNLDIRKPDKLFFPVGAVSGLLNGVSGISGPPVLIFLSNLKVSKMEFRATLITYFFFMNIFAALSFASAGLVSMEVIRYSAILIPFAIIGGLVGSRISTKLNETVFNRFVAVFLILMSINLFR